MEERVEMDLKVWKERILKNDNLQKHEQYSRNFSGNGFPSEQPSSRLQLRTDILFARQRTAYSWIIQSKLISCRQCGRKTGNTTKSGNKRLDRVV